MTEWLETIKSLKLCAGLFYYFLYRVLYVHLLVLHKQTIIRKPRFLMNQIIYKAEVPSWGIINLYNTSNRWIGKDQMYKGTNEKYSMSDVGEDMFDLASWRISRKKLRTILSNALGRDEKRMIGDKEIILTMYVNSTTGKIDDITFEFFEDSPYRFIPVLTYWKIEQEIKQSIQLTLTDAGRRLNYIYWWSGVKPEL